MQRGGMEIMRDRVRQGYRPGEKELWIGRPERRPLNKAVFVPVAIVVLLASTPIRIGGFAPSAVFIFPMILLITHSVRHLDVRDATTVYAVTTERLISLDARGQGFEMPIAHAAPEVWPTPDGRRITVRFGPNDATRFVDVRDGERLRSALERAGCGEIGGVDGVRPPAPPPPVLRPPIDEPTMDGPTEGGIDAPGWPVDDSPPRDDAASSPISEPGVFSWWRRPR